MYFSPYTSRVHTGGGTLDLRFRRDPEPRVDYLAARLLAPVPVGAHRVVLVRCGRCPSVLVELRGTVSQLIRADTRQPGRLRNAHDPEIFGSLASGAPHEFGCKCGYAATVNYRRLLRAYYEAAAQPRKRDRVITLPLD